jgi:cardiolipin synthase (CMP-forming)
LRLLPNLLTASRLIASPFVVWLLAQRRFRLALWVILAAAVTDWLDGFAARRLGVSGQFGVVLDPLADKVLLAAVFLTLGAIGLIPLWMLMLVIARDLVIVTGALLLRICKSVRRFRPSAVGKVSTFFQVVLVLLVLILAAYPLAAFSALARAALFSSAFFTILSGILYVRKGVLMAGDRWFED